MTIAYEKEDNDKEEKKLTIYKISVTISDVQNAATDSDLEIEIFGQKGTSGRLKLGTSETNSRKHDRGQTDHFTVSADGVGEVSSNGPGSIGGVGTGGPLDPNLL